MTFTPRQSYIITYTSSSHISAVTQLSLLFVSTTNFLDHLQQHYPLFVDVLQSLALSFHVALEGFLASLAPSPQTATPPCPTLLGHPLSIQSDSSPTVDVCLWQSEWLTRIFELRHPLNSSDLAPFNKNMLQVSRV